MGDVRRIGRVKKPTPVPVLAVVAIMAGIGVVLGQRVLRYMPEVLDLFLQANGDIRAWGALFLADDIALLGVALGCIALAIGIWFRRPEMRILTFIAAGLVAVTYFRGPTPPTLDMATLLGSLVVLALLGLSEPVRGWFDHRRTSAPHVVLAARTLAMALGPVLALRGLILLFAAPAGSEHYLIGGALLVGGATALVNHPRLLKGEVAARTTVSVALAIVIVAELWLTRGYFIYPGGFAAVVLGLMWIPEDAQLHFRH